VQYSRDPPASMQYVTYLAASQEVRPCRQEEVCVTQRKSWAGGVRKGWVGPTVFRGHARLSTHSPVCHVDHFIEHGALHSRRQIATWSHTAKNVSTCTDAHEEDASSVPVTRQPLTSCKSRGAHTALKGAVLAAPQGGVVGPGLHQVHGATVVTENRGRVGWVGGRSKTQTFSGLGHSQLAVAAALSCSLVKGETQLV
jgi:hypothetical protein